MKCNNCGYECGEDFNFCPNCSAQSAVVAAPIANPVGEKVMAALKSKIFLVICVLLTVASALSTFLGGGIPAINILYTIFLWIAYAKAQKNIVDTNQLKNLSGTVYAQCVILNVVSTILLVTGVISVVLTLVFGAFELPESILAHFGDIDLDISGVLVMLSGWLIFAVFTVLAVIMLLANIFIWRRIHRFAKSVYQSIDAYTQNLQYADTVNSCLLIFGLFHAVSAGSLLVDGGFVTAVSNACLAAATIFASQLVGKCFSYKK